MSRLSENFVIPYILKGADHGSGVDGDSVDMGKVHSFMWVLGFNAITGDAILTMSSGATEGVKTTSETFNYRLANGDQGAANSDVYAAWSTSSALTLSDTTYDNRTLIVEMKSDELTDGQPWMTLVISSAASNINVSVIGVGDPTRFAANTMPTVIK